MHKQSFSYFSRSIFNNNIGVFLSFFAMLNISSLTKICCISFSFYLSQSKKNDKIEKQILFFAQSRKFFSRENKLFPRSKFIFKKNRHSCVGAWNFLQNGVQNCVMQLHGSTELQSQIKKQ